jgi:Protein of unknown function (DUF2934)
MKNKSTRAAVGTAEPSESAIRDYAYHLYEQDGCVPNRDLEYWLEAIACLKAGIPASESHPRHRLLAKEENGKSAVVAA